VLLTRLMARARTELIGTGAGADLLRPHARPRWP